MSTERMLFWLIITSGTVLACWWLAVRPDATHRRVASPVAALLLVLAVLLSLLAMTGRSAPGMGAAAHAFAFGG